jgi:hypothetical protein
MELAAAVLLAGPLGHFCRTRRQGLGLYLLAWVVIFPIQTIVVHNANPDDISPLYFILNAVILTAGIGLNTFAARRRERRTVGIRADSGARAGG